jgi:hypothetical protein
LVSTSQHIECIHVLLSLFVLVQFVGQCRDIVLVNIPLSTHYQVVSGDSTTPTLNIIVVVASQGNNIIIIIIIIIIFDESS